jgi:drug/metabolite transporter (DMT)-like permease
MNKKFLAYLKLITVIILWGSNYHVAKFLVSDSDVYTISFFRFFLASILIWLIYYKHRHNNTKITVKNIILTFFVGLVGIFAYNIFFLKAETLISANNVAILYALTPSISVIFSRIFLKQQITLMGYMGILIALVGAILVILFSQKSCNQFICFDLLKQISYGQVLALLAAVCMASYNILNKKSAQNGLDPLSITAFSTTFGAILLFLTYLQYGNSISYFFNHGIKFWGAMIYISLFATVIGYKWYSESIRDIGVDKSAVFLNGVPLSAVIIGMIFFNDIVNIKIILSGCIIILGVLLTNYCVRKK